MGTSPFDALLSVRKQTSTQSPIETASPLDSYTARPLPVQSAKLAKSVDPAYLKFTTYVRKETHRAVKLKALYQNMEMSDLVEDLLSDWLK